MRLAATRSANRLSLSCGVVDGGIRVCSSFASTSEAPPSNAPVSNRLEPDRKPRRPTPVLRRFFFSIPSSWKSIRVSRFHGGRQNNFTPVFDLIFTKAIHRPHPSCQSSPFKKRRQLLVCSSFVSPV